MATCWSASNPTSSGAMIVDHEEIVAALVAAAVGNDLRIVGLEGPPVVANCMHHVIVGNTVLACTRLDVHKQIVNAEPSNVNTS